MASANKNRELIKEIKQGNEEVLLYLYRKYYTDVKRIYSSHQISDSEIPAQVAHAIVKIWMEIHRNGFSENIDLVSYLLNTATEDAERLASEKKADRKNKFRNNASDNKLPQEIVAECVNVLDDASRKALQWRYAENYSLQQVAEKLKADVAATHDLLGKSFLQLSSIVKIRMQ